jgi:hypothetical protein
MHCSEKKLNKHSTIVLIFQADGLKTVHPTTRRYYFSVLESSLRSIFSNYIYYMYILIYVYINIT